MAPECRPAPEGASPPPPTASPGRILLRALPLALISLFALATAAGESARLVGRAFPGFLVWDNGVLVAFHLRDWTGARAGLPLNGGRLLSVEGEPFRSGRELQDRVAAAPAGTPFRYVVAWRGRELAYTVRSMRLSSGDYLGTFGVYLLSGFAFLLIATVALALRPDLPAARYLGFSTASMGLLMTLSIDYLTAYRLVPVVQAVEGLTPASILGLALVFPVERIRPPARWLLVGGIALAFAALAAANAATFRSDPELARALTGVIYGAVAASGLLLLASLGHALLRADSVRARVQAAVVFGGALGALLLPAIGVLAFLLLGWNVSFTWIAVLLPLLPLSMLYAVLRHDLLGVERFVRLGLGYALATGAVVGAYALALLGFDRLVDRRPEADPVFSFFLLLAIALGFDPLRRRAQRVVDRVFYRSNLDGAEVLERASGELVDLSEEAEIRRRVAGIVSRELGLLRCAVLPPGQDDPNAALRQEIRFRDEHLGTLACGPKQSGAPFSAAEREVVKGVAAQAALALRNARSLEALRRAQEDLVRHERLAAIGELAGAVAHGIRNPLSGIQATAQVALEQGPTPDSLGAILEETARLDQRVRTLLDFSRPFEPKPRRTELRELLASVRRALAGRAEREAIAVELAAPETPVVVEVDPDYLEEAILELAGNALRVLEPGGRLTLRLREAPAGAVIRVEDTGPGIPEGVRHRLFDLFFTTRPGGTGVGLATVRKIVERQGGAVRLESSGEAGSVFCIELPRGAGARPDGGAPGRPGPPGSDGSRGPRRRNPKAPHGGPGEDGS